MSEGDEPRVTVVVPAWNSLRWLPVCLQALAQQTYRDFRTLVVDSGSTDDSVRRLESDFSAVEVLRLTENRGFAVAVNAGIDRATSPYVALLNVDTRVEPEWLERLVAALDAAPNEVAGVGSQLLQMEYPDRIDDAGDTLSWFGSAAKRGHGQPVGSFEKPGEIFSICAAAALYRADFLAVERFDSVFESYFEDVDLCVRGRIRGYSFLYEPGAKVLHWSGGAELGRGRYVAQVTRNRLMTFVKSIPASLLFRHAFRLLWGQLYFFVAYRRPLASFRGYASFARNLGHTLAQRRRLAAVRRTTPVEIDGLLERNLGEPPLRRIVWRKLTGSRDVSEAGARG